MRFVSLNMDLHDAASLRRAVAGAITHCPCTGSGMSTRCDACASLIGIASDLDYLLSRSNGPSTNREGSRANQGASPIAIDPRAHPVTHDARPVPHSDRRLRVVPELLTDR